MRRWVIALLCGAASLAAGLAEATDAQAIQVSPGDYLVIPGSPAACQRAAGLPGSPVEPERLPLQLVRTLHESEGGGRIGLRGLLRYLEAHQQLRKAWDTVRSADGDLSLKAATEDRSRKRQEKLLSLLGLEIAKAGSEIRVREKSGPNTSTEPAALGAPPASDVGSGTGRLDEFGTDRADLLRRLNGGERVAITLPSFSVPLPLPTRLWSEVIFRQAVPSEDLFLEIIADRRTSLLFYGLAALDAETRRFLEQEPDLLAKLHSEVPELLAAFGRSLRIRNGLVETPGGEAGREAWESLVGEKVTRPLDFVQEVLSRDGGHLAFFYDTLAHLDPPRTRFALGLWIENARQRRNRFWALYDISRSSQWAGTRWSWRLRPFSRDTLDLYIVLSQVRVTETGAPTPPALAGFWEHVLSKPGAIESAADLRWEDVGDKTIDAAWLAETVLGQDDTGARRAILDTILFAQRVFAGAPEASVGAVVSALRGFAQCPMLMLGLERMGIADPGVYVTALHRAVELSRIGKRVEAWTTMAQFQGALALVARARMVGRLSPSDTAALVLSLSSLRLDNDDNYAGAVADWIAERFLPALAEPTGLQPNEAREIVLLRALADAPRTDESPETRPTVQWEGWEYQIDTLGSALSRLEVVRKKHGGNSLDAVLALRSVSARLESGVRTVDELTLLAEELRAVLAELQEPRSTVPSSERLITVKESANYVLRELGRIRQPQQLGRVSRSAESLRLLMDALLADVLPSLVYAFYLGDPEGPALLGGDVANRHVFGIDANEPAARLRGAWEWPSEQIARGRRWHVQGSLMGLDVALARLALPRLGAGGSTGSAVLTEEDFTALVQSVRLFNPYWVGDQSMQAIAAAIKHGRDVVTSLTRDAARLDAVCEAAGVDEWTRYYEIPWLVDRDPSAVAVRLSPTELFWVGFLNSGGVLAVPGGEYDLWGAPSFPLDGCLCLVLPRPGAWANFAGRPGRGYLAARAADLPLRLAEVLTDLKIPARLVGAILPSALRDFLDQVDPRDQSDLRALARHAGGLPQHVVEDYVSKLTVVGPLVPVRRPQ